MTFIVYFPAIEHACCEMYYAGGALHKTSPVYERAHRFKNEGAAEAVAAIVGALYRATVDEAES